MAYKAVRKLHYFEFCGVAESIRYMLHYGNMKFEDIRHDSRNWPIKTVRDFLPYGQLPFYEEGTRTLNQSLAIARYVANFQNLVPSDPWEQARIDAVVYNIYDFRQIVQDFISQRDPVKKESTRKQILGKTVDYFFSRLEKQLEKSNGLFGEKNTKINMMPVRSLLSELLSWAEFVYIGITEGSSQFLGEEIEKNYPSTVVLFTKIRSLPGVKEYIAQRKPYVRPLKYQIVE